MLVVVLVGEILPNFGPMLNLIGGSMLALTSLIYPCVFYLYLSVGEKLECERQEQPVKNQINTPTINEDGSEHISIIT